MNSPSTHDAGDAHPPEHDFTGPLSPGVARILRGLFVVCGALVALDLVLERTSHAPGESLPGFYAAYGFVGCVLLVLAAKQMRRVVGKRPDHYEPVDGAAPATRPQGGGAQGGEVQGGGEHAGEEHGC